MISFIVSVEKEMTLFSISSSDKFSNEVEDYLEEEEEEVDDLEEFNDLALLKSIKSPQLNTSFSSPS